MREDVADLLKRLEDTQKGETICLKYDDVRKILRLLTDHGKTEITGNTLDTETILDGLDHMAGACKGISCNNCRLQNKKKTEPFTCAMDKGNIAENAARLIEDQAERIAIMSEGGFVPISRKKPPYDKDVLLCLKNGGYFIGHRKNSWGQDIYCDDELGSGCVFPTHWMELPESPKEGEA